MPGDRPRGVVAGARSLQSGRSTLRRYLGSIAVDAAILLIPWDLLVDLVDRDPMLTGLIVAAACFRAWLDSADFGSLSGPLPCGRGSVLCAGRLPGLGGSRPTGNW